MADWAAALAQGLGAAANTGATDIGNQIKTDQQLQAQQQLQQTAADTQLDLHQRMAAADQMMKNAAINRYADIVKQQMAVPTAVSAPTIQQTGLTPASFVQPGTPQAPVSTAAAGADDEEDDDDDDSSPTPAPAAPAAGAPQGPSFSFVGDANKINQLMADAQGTLKNPTATTDQKEAAQATIDGLTQQLANQTAANKASVSGQTRKRTLEEAVDAANEYALQNDPEAYVAGTTAYNAANSDDMAQKRLDQQLKITQAAGDRQITLETMRENSRFAQEMAKLDANSGAGAKDPADVATIKYLVDQGMSFQDARGAVLGNGAGALKDPIALATTLAASGQVTVPRGAPPGAAFAQALKMILAARAQATGGASSGMLNSPAPGNTVANPFNTPGLPQGGADPLGLFNQQGN